MSVSSDPSFSTTETLIKSLRRDIGEISKRAIEMTNFAREAQATLWEIERRHAQEALRDHPMKGQEDE